MKFKFLILLILILISFNFVNSKSVCGEVFTKENITPTWFKVHIYSDNSLEETNCLISPEDFKYCCPIGYNGSISSWNIGDKIWAEIIDVDSGYVATPVKLELTELSYDIFPKLELKKVINVYSPLKKVNISSSNLTFFNISFLEEYSNVKFNDEPIYLGNGFFSQDKEISFGKNIFQIKASRGDVEFTQTINYTLLEEVNFSRIVECDKCSNNKIKKNQEVNISVKINFSSNISELYIYEYVPIDWEILNISRGEFYYSGEDYNVIAWKVMGNSLEENYVVYVPDYEEVNYTFMNYLEDFKVNEEQFLLYKYIPFVPPKKSSGGQGGSKGKYSPTVFSKVDSIHPLIGENKSLRMAIYSANFTNQGSVEILYSSDFEKIKNRSLDFVESYSINSNLGNNFDRISFELNLNHTLINEKNYTSFDIYGKNSKGKMVPLTGNTIDNGENLKFIFDSEEFYNEIVIFGVKSHLTWWDKFVQWFWNVFGFRTGII